jgi:hypothetical protein
VWHSPDQQACFDGSPELKPEKIPEPSEQKGPFNNDNPYNKTGERTEACQTHYFRLQTRHFNPSELSDKFDKVKTNLA